MSEFGINLIWASCLFVLIFLINFLWVFKRGYENIKKQKKKKKGMKGWLVLIVTVFLVISSIPWSIGFSMLLGFVLLFGLIYSLYEFLGRSLVKKGWSKNV